MKEDVADRFSSQIPDPATMRLHMGELTGEEILVAQSAYRLALVQSQSSASSDTVEMLTQALEQAEQSLQDLARFADKHGSCTSCSIEHVAAGIAQVLRSPEVRFVPRPDPAPRPAAPARPR